MSDSPIIPIRPEVQYMPPEDYEPPELKIVVQKPDSYKCCPHDYIKVFPHHRIVTCTNCGETLDPFNHILQVAQQEGNALSYLKYLKLQEKHYQQEIEKLKKEVAALKTQKKN